MKQHVLSEGEKNKTKQTRTSRFYSQSIFLTNFCYLEPLKLQTEVVFVKDSILAIDPKYERRRREKNRARSASTSAEGARVAGGERRAQRAFRGRRKRFREAESSLCYYGQIPIAFKSRYLSKLDTPLHEEAQIYCPN